VSTLRVHGTASVVAGRPLASVVLRCLVILTIASILVCLPAIHGAMNLHQNGDVLDAFDLGINVPQTTRGSLAAIILGVLVLAGLWHESMSRGALRPLDDLTRPEASRSLSVLRHPLPVRPRSHAGMPSRESDDDHACPSSGSMLCMVTTPRFRAKARSTGGFFFATNLGSTLQMRSDRLRTVSSRASSRTRTGGGAHLRRNRDGP